MAARRGARCLGGMLRDTRSLPDCHQNLDIHRMEGLQLEPLSNET